MDLQKNRPWWQTEVIYQIYPRSFQDSNGDGIGDLQGIISRLDYLQELGIGAIWLSPIYPSPMCDFGYDVSDYVAISPEFGSMDDFKRLLSEAHRRDIKIVLDLVLNHTSHEHTWFREASSSRDNPKRDWYIWHDGKPPRSGRPRPPNNWRSAFGGRAWQWHEQTNQYYLHTFLPQQPDVNWRNPELREAMWSVIRYWLELGVDGFRLDVVNWFIKDQQLRNNPWGKWGLRPYDWQRHIYDRNRPETLEIMREIRNLVDQYPDRMTVGEVFTEPPGDPRLVASYYDGGAGLHLAFNFAFLFCKWRASSFARTVEEWEDLLGDQLWPNYTLSNHDQPRAISRYAKGQETEARARVSAAMLLTLRGTPFVYYGEEIGMHNGSIPRKSLQDPVGKRYWPFHPGRDGERTPMQWDDTTFAGFSQTQPWLPINADAPLRNAKHQRSDASSLFSWYQSLITLRKTEAALHIGTYRTILANSDVFCFERVCGDERLFIALNFSNRTQDISQPNTQRWQIILASNRSTRDIITTTDLKLDPYEVLISKASADHND
jgi:alpha-glucosidase